RSWSAPASAAPLSVSPCVQASLSPFAATNVYVPRNVPLAVEKSKLSDWALPLPVYLPRWVARPLTLYGVSPPVIENPLGPLPLPVTFHGTTWARAEPAARPKTIRAANPNHRIPHVMTA